MAVHDGQTERAVVPIENSLEGGVAATLDALAGEASDVRIVAEVIHPIHHCLIARAPLELGAITRVISHPQAMAQCGGLLRGALAGAERVSSISTAEAVRGGRRESDEPWAALAVPALGRALRLHGARRRRGRVRRQRDALRLAGSGGRGRRGRRVEDVDRLLGFQRRVARARWSTCCANCRTARSTSRGSSLGRGASDSATTCSSPTSRAPRRTPTCGRPSRRCRGAWKSCECWGRTRARSYSLRRVLGVRGTNGRVLVLNASFEP